MKIDMATIKNKRVHEYLQSSNSEPADSVKKEELTLYEQKILQEKSNFRNLHQSDQADYMYETACMFDFLGDMMEKIYSKERQAAPSDNASFGLYLLHDYVGIRIRASEVDR